MVLECELFKNIPLHVQDLNYEKLECDPLVFVGYKIMLGKKN
jgi:hypothetical protein